MAVHQRFNIFTDSELKALHDKINSIHIPLIGENHIDNKENNGVGANYDLGRLQFGGLQILNNINEKIAKIVKEISDIPLEQDHVTAVEYTSRYGQPNLPPHFDHDTNDIVVDFQLSANTSWDLGVDTKNYEMSDNSALIFNANEHIHWRPHKTFKEGEYVRMIFWRFYNPSKRSDYSNLDYSASHDIFKEANAFRDSLGNT